MVFPPSRPNPSNPEEPYTLGRFLAGLFTVLVPVGLMAYQQTKSFTISLFSIAMVPCCAILQGAEGLLRYRFYFGTPPFPRNPAHGVVVVSPDDAQDDDKNKEDYIGTYSGGGCQCEGGRRWRRGGKLSPKEQEYLDDCLHKKEPVRMLVIGDSLALGLGTDRSCMPLMPETLAKSISKRTQRAVYWTSYGAEGAASSWTLKELARKAQKDVTLRRKQQKGKSTEIAPGGVSISDDTASDYSSGDDEDVTTSTTNATGTETRKNPTNTSFSLKDTSKQKSDSINLKMKENDEKDDVFGEWKKRLHSFRETFENDIEGPYDIVFIFAGGNDAKSAFIPFYVKTAKGEDTSTSFMMQDGRDQSLFSEFERIMECLGPKMNTDFIHNNLNTSSSKTKNSPNFPLVVFPKMPPLMIPAFQKIPLLWFVAPLTGMIENNKRRLQRKYRKNVLCIDSPTSEAAGLFEEQRGLIWNQRVREDVLLCLRDITTEKCQEIVRSMHEHVTKKSEVHYGKHNKELRHAPTKEITQPNAPFPRLCDLKGYKQGHSIFSVDYIHPNDEGYDFWGRFIANGVFSQVPSLSS